MSETEGETLSVWCVGFSQQRQAGEARLERRGGRMADDGWRGGFDSFVGQVEGSGSEVWERRGVLSSRQKHVNPMRQLGRQIEALQVVY